MVHHLAPLRPAGAVVQQDLEAGRIRAAEVIGERTKRMPLPRQNRQGTSQSLNWPCALRITLSVFLFIGLAAHSPAQVPQPAPPPAKAEPAAPLDPLGRETPRRAMMSLLKYGERQDFTTGARFLQPVPGQDIDLVQRTREIQALRHKFKGDVDLLSDDPNGTVEAGLPPGEVRAGVYAVGGTTTDVILVQVDDPKFGKIWLISKDTVAKIPDLYAQMEREGPTAAD